jgi:hypothetical protein
VPDSLPNSSVFSRWNSAIADGSTRKIGMRLPLAVSKIASGGRLIERRPRLRSAENRFFVTKTSPVSVVLILTNYHSADDVPFIGHEQAISAKDGAPDSQMLGKSPNGAN